MNEEEKQAIELLKKLQKKTPCIIWEDGTPYNKSNQIQTILDLIERQQEQIEELKDKNKTLEIEFEIKKYCKVNELASDLIFYKNLARDYQGNCISKDKIRKLKELVHKTLDDNGITRGYQLTIDNYFKELLGE